jgi:hypothetical protein
VTLREAIEQAISLGESDPVAIAHQIVLRHGVETVLSEVDPVEYAADIARGVLGSRRRAGIRSLAHVDTAHKRDLMLDVKWLPGLGYVKLGDCSADDFDLAAATYEKAAGTLSRYAVWCRAQSALIREQGVEKYRQVKGALPALEPAEVAI